MKKTGRIIAVLATATLIAGSLSGCGISSMFAKKDVVEAATNFADAVTKADASKIMKCAVDDDDVEEALEEVLSDDNYSSDDAADFADAVLKTLEYEIDESSFEADGDEASIKITFKLADYESLEDEDFDDIDDLIDAVEDCDTQEVEFTAKFTKEDKEWLVSNADDKKIIKMYDISGFSLPICSVGGSYTSEVDLTDAIVSDLAGNMSGVTLDGSIVMKCNLTLEDDGTFYIEFDSDDFKAQMKTFLEDNVDNIIMGLLGVSSVEDAESMAALSGYSYSDLKDMLLDEIDDEIDGEMDSAGFDDMNYSGTYTVDGNTICFEDSDDAVATISGDTITLDVSDIDGLNEYTDALVFVKN
ncbi:hypothetical protein SAMN02910370_00603 [Lachnospiraceae bacterium XPB1003]|nr:hypothetical protein SAMN02910370_00603 [Lachnospiraceae bacterium XPB1003]